MLSRVAECLFWLNRYTERADNVSRFLEVNHFLSLDLPKELGSQWMPLVSITGDVLLFTELYGEEFRKDDVIRFLAWDIRNANSILSCLQASRENARVVRDQLPDEAWESINQAWLLANGSSWHQDLRKNPYEALLAIRGYFKEYLGIVETTMSRDEAWYFSLLGMTLERAEKTSRILDVKYFLLLPRVEDVGSNLDILQWESLLRSAGALQMYRRKHKSLTPENIVDFLVLDREFPRSIHFCLEKANKALHEISGAPLEHISNEVERTLGRILAEIHYSSPPEILETGLHEFLNDLQIKFNRVGEEIAQNFFLTTDSLQSISSPGSRNP